MSIKNYSNKLFLFFCVVVLISCDTDKYFTSSLKFAQNPGDSTLIKGIIKRKDNSQVITWATVKIGYTQTVNDSLGKFEIEIPISSDENRNILTPMIVSAFNYETYYDYIYVVPQTTEKDINLVYAAPIFLTTSMTLGSTDDSKTIYRFFANVKDYQGASDIVAVNATAWDENKGKNITISLHRVSVIDELSSRWESEKYVGSLLMDRSGRVNVLFYARDNAGHTTSTIQKLY